MRLCAHARSIHIPLGFKHYHVNEIQKWAQKYPNPTPYFSNGAAQNIYSCAGSAMRSSSVDPSRYSCLQRHNFP